MLAATTTGIVRPIGVLLGGNGRCRQGFATPARPCALLRPCPYGIRRTSRRHCAAAHPEVGRHD